MRRRICDAVESIVLTVRYKWDRRTELQNTNEHVIPHRTAQQGPTFRTAKY